MTNPLAATLQETGLSQARFARIWGRKPRHLNEVLRGRAEPTETLLAEARATLLMHRLGVLLRWLDVAESRAEMPPAMPAGARDPAVDNDDAAVSIAIPVIDQMVTMMISTGFHPVEPLIAALSVIVDRLRAGLGDARTAAELRNFAALIEPGSPAGNA